MPPLWGYLTLTVVGCITDPPPFTLRPSPHRKRRTSHWQTAYFFWPHPLEYVGAILPRLLTNRLTGKEPLGFLCPPQPVQQTCSCWSFQPATLTEAAFFFFFYSPHATGMEGDIFTFFFMPGRDSPLNHILLLPRLQLLSLHP